MSFLKNRFPLLISCVGLPAVLLFSSCDIIDEPRREGIRTEGDFVCIDQASETRKVLMEEYSGMKCGNCPAKSKEAQSYIADYEGRFILNTIHAGGFADPDGGGLYTPDFRTPTGDQLNEDFGLQTYPNAVINRSAYNGDLVLGSTDWQPKIEEELQKPLDVKMCIASDYDTETDLISVDVNMEYLNAGDSEDFLSVYLIADTVFGPQKWYFNEPENVTDYPHVNLLRGSFNGTYGTRVSDSTIVAGDRFALSFEQQLTSFNRVMAGDWQRLKVLAFIYNNTTGEIKQAEEVYISQS